MQQEQTQHNALDDYWQRQELIATLPVAARSDERAVFFLWHESREQYGRNHRELGITLPQPGERDYVHVRACFYSPRLILTVSLSTPALPAETNLGEQIGEVVDSHREGQTRHEIGNLQAWYYEVEKTLMLWEVDLFVADGEENPTTDFLLSSLWVSFEAGLLQRFPDCAQILTPHREPKYADALWQAFLQARGYAAGEPGSGVFRKVIRSQ